MNHAATFAAVFVALFVAHQLGDQWIQSHRAATAKGRAGWAGRVACAEHVATYTLTGLVAVLAAAMVLDLRLGLWRVAAGFAVSALTHYWADRRVPLERFAQAIGRGPYLDYGTVVRKPGQPVQTAGPGTALFHLDQSWHYAWLFVAALIIA